MRTRHAQLNTNAFIDEAGGSATRRGRALVALLVGLTILAAPSATALDRELIQDGNTEHVAESYFVSATAGGEIYPFGAAAYFGSMADLRPESDEILDSEYVVGVTASSSGNGYWVASADGTVASFGDASDHGDGSHLPLAEHIKGIAATPSGDGYWLVAGDGGVFTFGDAGYYGAASTITLAAEVVGIASTPTGNGYWLVAADGGVFSFGDAQFHGSAGAIPLNEPITAMVATLDGGGYWLFAQDGGVFTYGNAPFHGSLGATNLENETIIGGSPSIDGAGYWIAGNLGSVWPFGGVGDFGSASSGPDEPISGIAARPQGDGYWLVTSPGQIWTGPPIPAHVGTGQRIIYSNSDQRIWLIEADGRVFDSYLVSGKYLDPLPGTYAVFSKSRYAFAGHDGITMDHMVRFAHGRRLAIGFHSIPKYGNGVPMQTVEQLGTYRSSGCVRQRPDQAERLFAWAPIGTPVIVLG
ncbi:MAG: L,D-transpeptidase [Acidimicrobiales bacterium]|jgi:hypothetical protein